MHISSRRGLLIAASVILTTVVSDGRLPGSLVTREHPVLAAVRQEYADVQDGEWIARAVDALEHAARTAPARPTNDENALRHLLRERPAQDILAALNRGTLDRGTHALLLRLAFTEEDREELPERLRRGQRAVARGERIARRKAREASREQVGPIGGWPLDEEHRAQAVVADAGVQVQIGELERNRPQLEKRLRTEALRELLRRGLMDSGTAWRVRSEWGEDFLWPVDGRRISAGFLDAAYKRFFGIPHRGIDIVVPHGTPIFAAADGIVFTARDGGARGYSYLLIGHRDGFATLYGHLSESVVSEGQHIRAGQTLGLSGGTPGTNGAGRITTGAHLHFEVIRNGTHMDPRLLFE